MLTFDTQTFDGDSLLYGHSLSYQSTTINHQYKLTGEIGHSQSSIWCCPEILDAFDLHRDEIYIGREHIFYFQVASIEDDGNGRGELPESTESQYYIERLPG